MKPVTLIDHEYLELIISRLCHQLIENHDHFSHSALIGIQPRGVELAERIKQRLEEIQPGLELNFGKLDITFHRDDFRRREEPLAPNATQLDFLIENKKVVLIDDVLYTGRTIRSAMDALLSFGRPDTVELLCLIDRRFARHLPIQPTYIGKSVDSYDNQRVKVDFDAMGGKGKVSLYTTPSDE